MTGSIFFKSRIGYERALSFTTANDPIPYARLLKPPSGRHLSSKVITQTPYSITEAFLHAVAPSRDSYRTVLIRRSGYHAKGGGVRQRRRSEYHGSCLRCCFSSPVGYSNVTSSWTLLRDCEWRLSRREGFYWCWWRRSDRWSSFGGRGRHWFRR